MDVLVPGRGSRFRPGIAIRRTRDLPADHVTEIDGIPVTTVERTLLDLASIVPERQLRKAVAEAARQESSTSPPSLPYAPAARAAGERETSRGSPSSSAARSPPPAPTPSASSSTSASAGVCRRRPSTSQSPATRPTSSGPLPASSSRSTATATTAPGPSRSSDRAKDAALQVAGLKVLRYTEATLLAEEDRVFAQIGALLDP